MAEQKKHKKNSGLKTAPTARQLLEGAGDIHLSKKAVVSAKTAATAFAQEIATETFARTKTQRLKVSTAGGMEYNPLRSALEARCSSIKCKEVCRDTRAANSHGSRSARKVEGRGTINVTTNHSEGVALATARRVFLGRDFKGRSVSGDMETQVANLIDVYLRHLGHKAAMLADVAGRKTISAKHIEVAAQLIH
jgi:histone H3/H4